MKEKTKYYIACFVTATLITIFLIGFYMGKKSIVVITKVEYIKGETIRDTVNVAILVPEKVEIPSNPIFIYKTDTINKIIVQQVDTAKIIEDWVMNRKYNLTLFDNDNGKLNIDASVQYNQLKDLRYSFTPIQQVITKQKEQVLQSFVSGSYSSFNYIGLGGGVFYHNLGLEYQFQRDFKIGDNGHSFGLKYKF